MADLSKKITSSRKPIAKLILLPSFSNSHKTIAGAFIGLLGFYNPKNMVCIGALSVLKIFQDVSP